MSKECKNCGQSLNDEDEYCPACGTPVNKKRLYRSKTDSRILGVCGGLGEYFNIDSNLIRVIATLIILSTAIAPGLIVYFIAGIIIPERD